MPPHSTSSRVWRVVAGGRDSKLANACFRPIADVDVRWQTNAMDQDSLKERLQLLREYYYIQAPLLVLVLAVSKDDGPVLAWTAGMLLVLLTINVIIPHIREE
jgi:hypothetical protein